MTSWNINLFSLFTFGCIALLFGRNVHSYPHKEFEFPKWFEDSESNEDEAVQHEIQTTTATAYIRENQSQTFNTNLRSSISQNSSTSLDKTDKNETHIEQRQLHKHQQNGVSTTVQRDVIYFPTDQPGPELVCNNSIFCENVANYPENMINNIIKKNDSIKYLATEDVLSDILERFNPNEEPLCKSESQIIYPQMGKSKEKGYLTVVNQQNFKQGVRIEKCINEDKCSIDDSNIPEGYTTKCVQKYIDRKLLALTGDSEVTQEVFPIPSSCCCHLKFTPNPLERFGMGTKQGSQTTPAKNPKK